MQGVPYYFFLVVELHDRMISSIHKIHILNIRRTLCGNYANYVDLGQEMK